MIVPDNWEEQAYVLERLDFMKRQEKEAREAGDEGEASLNALLYRVFRRKFREVFGYDPEITEHRS